MSTPVIFRIDEHGVIALFPNEAADYQGRYITCFDLQCSHGSADYQGVMDSTSPAPQSKLETIKRVLTVNYGYDLEEVTEQTEEHREHIKAELQRILK